MSEVTQSEPTTPVEPSGRIGRTKRRASDAGERARARAEQLRNEVPAADAGWEAYFEDSEMAGSLLSGAVAFRLFLWLLPFTLVTVVGFGFVADASKESTDSLARTAGIRGLAAQQIDSATDASTKGRWLLLAVGLFALVSTSNSLVKVLWRIHELAWRLPRAKAPSKAKAIGGLILLAVAFAAMSAVVARVREASEVLGLGVVVVAVASWAAIWLAASMALPHGDAPWTALVPGALFVALCTEVLRFLTVYYVAGKVSSSSSLYGGLGAAVALLGWLYLAGRAMTASAVLNSTLWARRQRGSSNSFRRTRSG